MSDHPSGAIAPRVTRRTVARGAAWSAPAIALCSTAPAVSASTPPRPEDPCVPQDLVVDWSNQAVWTRDPGGAWARAVLNAGKPNELRMTVATRIVGSMRLGSIDGAKGNDSLALSPEPIGGTPDPGLTFHQSQTSAQPGGWNNRVIYSVAFTDGAGAPVVVSNLRFTITDIDSTAGDFWDCVALSSGFALTSLGAGVHGSGTTSDPLRTTAENGPVPNHSGQGSAQVFYPKTGGFSIAYWSAATYFSGVDTDQKIFLSNISFRYQKTIGC
ncbi:hypothetical protein [Falsarthrobacter nasiphocae]|uniref:Uncharacterized protein n=1 Tax=Falsarthrobacter nasiphocae TaxID=189863 RepID=A0AAE3YFL3_9MICC|nr:hypothetical protein [Falsarthrobacter nasiphocae]MDR6892275.1 hypothetical protein [Falsarthrobacter nasiphocae]